ncbi:MAG: M24 family metallopeptidase [Terriglobales bacterium]|jgi:Xaa-Pro aminopeptidase
MKLEEIQAALRSRQIDAWLFYDHHHRDQIAYRILGLPATLFVTRRWFYLIPAEGEPHKLVHRIEAGHLDSLPGAKGEYSSYQELAAGVENMLRGRKTVAMQYSPRNMVPYIGLVDAGTIEMVRGFGVDVVTSGDLVAQFEATWTPVQIASHFEAGKLVDKITEEVFREIGRRVRGGGTHEYEIQQWIEGAFQRAGLTDDNDPPIVAVNAHSGNPHYGPTADHSAPIREGDFVLLDIWARLQAPGSVYYDITWTGVVGKTPGDRHREIFSIVTGARDTGVKTAQEAVAAGKRICGWQVDQAVREYIDRSGYGKYFVHRTGHSIGETVHGNGANMDNLETKDEREIVPNSCFSVEPGIYLPEFGVRSEVDVLVHEGRAEVTGNIQRELVSI